MRGIHSAITIAGVALGFLAASSAAPASAAPAPVPVVVSMPSAPRAAMSIDPGFFVQIGPKAVDSAFYTPIGPKVIDPGFYVEVPAHASIDEAGG